MKRALVFTMTILGSMNAMSNETLPPLKDGFVPKTGEELWAGYDPQKEPLDVEVLKEWEEDGVVLKVLRYRIGIFKGQKAMMAAVYGYPKVGHKLPGLVQVHGGGQFADYKAVLTNAKRGYATISISWAGRIAAPGYHVDPAIVKLFWDGKTNDPNYKVTTDWGALDAYHSPSRHDKDAFVTIPVYPWSLDTVESPRNNSWFLCALGARRALTFLEQQPQVDASRLGVYGHSMGGKITVLTAGSDKRVKAAAPSCGGISDRNNNNALYRATLGDDVYLKNITCPVMFLSPANDFHGRINDLQTAVKEIKSQDWRVTCAPHHNHQDTPEYEVATQLWFDQHLKGAFKTPATPVTVLDLKTKSGVPSFTVKPAAAKKVLSVDVFYTQQGKEEAKDDLVNTIARFWHHASTQQRGAKWTADLPVLDTGRPLWVYANVHYALDMPVTGAGYYYRTYTVTTFNVSSLMSVAIPAQLQAAGVKATVQPSLVIETFSGDWQKEWFAYRPESWAQTTHKVYEPQWLAPVGAGLALDVRSAQPNKITVGLDGYAAEVSLGGGVDWQTVTLKSSDFHDAEGQTLSGWAGLKELRLGARETLRSKKEGATPLSLGGDWKGAAPEFRNLRWDTGAAGKPERS